MLLVVGRHIYCGVAPSDSDETQDDLLHGLFRREDVLRASVGVDGEDPVDVGESIGRRGGMSRNGDVGEEGKLESV